MLPNTEFLSREQVVTAGRGYADKAGEFVAGGLILSSEVQQELNRIQQLLYSRFGSGASGESAIKFQEAASLIRRNIDPAELHMMGAIACIKDQTQEDEQAERESHHLRALN